MQERIIIFFFNSKDVRETRLCVRQALAGDNLRALRSYNSSSSIVPAVAVRRSMILQLQSERANPLGTHEHNPEMGPDIGARYAEVRER